MRDDNLETITTENPDKFENVQSEPVNSKDGREEKDPKIHDVIRGDSLTSISVKYDVPKDVLIKLNDIEDPNLLTIGQKLRLPDKV